MEWLQLGLSLFGTFVLAGGMLWAGARTVQQLRSDLAQAMTRGDCAKARSECGAATVIRIEAAAGRVETAIGELRSDLAETREHLANLNGRFTETKRQV